MRDSSPALTIEGARQHNLKNVNCRIPLGKMTACCGVSGSGKSSLALDTIYAEGRRRYMENLSSYARQLLVQLERPQFTRIRGLSPTLAVDQDLRGQNPRSTVATLSEVHDPLRVIFARLGVQHCPKCNRALGHYDPDAIRRAQQNLPEGTRFYVCAPVSLAQDQDKLAHLKDFESQGFTRVRLGERIVTFEDLSENDINDLGDFEIVVDRMVQKPGQEARLADSIETALRVGQGRLNLVLLDGKVQSNHRFSTFLECPDCHLALDPLTPQSLSSNHPRGYCPDCKGLGLAVASSKKSEDEELALEFLEESACPTCIGQRLNAASRAVRLQGVTLPEFESLPISQALDFIKNLKNDTPEAIATLELQHDVAARLQLICDLGLSYLSLGRSAPTLSGGESQRLRLAGQVGGELSGVTYILDEPSTGLHPVDSERLTEALFTLRDQGNTVILVEHELSLLRRADYLIDFGPGPGSRGGEIVAQGSVDDLIAEPRSITGAWLSGHHDFPEPSPREPNFSKTLQLRGCTGHNIKQVDLELPLGRLIGIAGISGAGKSSLIAGTLYPALAAKLYKSQQKSLPFKELRGFEHLTKVIRVDQRPLGRSPRSNAATYTGAFEIIRELFAETKEARAYGFTASRFSFNVKGGRCEVCHGDGQRKIELHLLADVKVPCDACNGQRFNDATLRVRYKGMNIAEILSLSCDEAAAFFEPVPKLKRIFQALCEVGLGYLTIGQPANTLSGGEAERIKLAAELASEDQGTTLYLLDEPSRGLHPEDQLQLLRVLQALVERGNTVVLVEHNPALLAQTDWLIELGPGAGENGGRIVAQGLPSEVANSSESQTAPYLRSWLKNASATNTKPRTKRAPRSSKKSIDS